MMNLNDTISAFKCCTQIPPRCKECPLTEMCKWNMSKDRCKNEVKLSVYHWLKAQEPVEPDIDGNVEYDGHGSWWHVCGVCRQPIDKGDKFCRWCGRAVKWE